MTISNLKELAKLIDLCRKKGVQAITVDGVVLTLGEAPLKRNEASTATEDNIQVENEYTEDDMRFWSATSHG